MKSLAWDEQVNASHANTAPQKGIEYVTALFLWRGRHNRTFTGGFFACGGGRFPGYSGVTFTNRSFAAPLRYVRDCAGATSESPFHGLLDLVNRVR